MTLSIYRGEKKVWNCAATDGGSAVDLTGGTLRFVVRANYPDGSITTDTDALVSKSTADGITVTDAAGGLFTVTLAAADTNTITPGDYLYGVELSKAGGGPYVLDQGMISIAYDIVRTA